MARNVAVIQIAIDRAESFAESLGDLDYNDFAGEDALKIAQFNLSNIIDLLESYIPE